MHRMLVAPWHGRVTAGKIHLSSGGVRPTNQPIMHSLAAFGPGDTHRIVVAGVPAISPAEVAATPAGGQYWAGKAIITGCFLYGAVVSWIYQAGDGSKWAVHISRSEIEASTSQLRLIFNRFGEFGRPREVHERNFEFPWGQLDRESRGKVFSDLGDAASCAIKLHAVSNTGRTAVFAWTAFNSVSTETASKNIDARPRPYMFLKITLTGSGENIGASSQVLFDFDDIWFEQIDIAGGGFRSLGFPDMEESNRQTLYDDEGEIYGARITMDYVSEIPMPPSNGPGPGVFQTSGSYQVESKWLAMVVFEGEVPKPCYFTVSSHDYLNGMSFSVSTKQSYIYVEFLDGSTKTEQDGIPVITGGGSSQGSATVKWTGPGASWVRSVEFSSSASFNGTTTATASSFDGELSFGSTPGLIDQGPIGAPSITGDPASRMPTIGLWKLCLYSNNLIGVAKIKQTQDGMPTGGKFEGVITAEGFIPHVAEYSHYDMRHYGSYNPVTREFVVGASDLVNWA